MAVEMVKMSSKGQIVIPQDIREEICASEGTMFAVVSGRDSIVLKKVATPSKEELIRELGEIAKEGKKRLESKGIRETDIPSIVEKARKR
jgi:AbrB family looped-hinge helix DNA binding protein